MFSRIIMIFYEQIKKICITDNKEGFVLKIKENLKTIGLLTLSVLVLAGCSQMEIVQR